MRTLIVSLLVLAVPSGAAFASESAEDVITAARGADIVILGESHDNPDHHALQAQVTQALSPNAIVFEMLEWGHVRALQSVARDDIDAMQSATAWEARGWPDFASYAPIFQAAPDAVLYAGQLNGRTAATLVQNGLHAVLPKPLITAGLAAPLPTTQQHAREDMQFAAHCDALPREMLPMMVDIQRLRDATLTFAALKAFEKHGGPVVVIAGNGHARPDWGVPAMLSAVAPDLLVLAVGQGEDGQMPEGGFSTTSNAPAPKRTDPCAAFK